MPYYISIGMSYDDFWQSSPILCAVYRESHTLQMQQQNEMLWASGVYMIRAIRCAFDKESKYPEKPLDFGIIKKTPEQKEAELRAAQKKADADFERWVKAAMAQQERRNKNKETGKEVNNG